MSCTSSDSLVSSQLAVHKIIFRGEMGSGRGRVGELLEKFMESTRRE